MASITLKNTDTEHNVTIINHGSGKVDIPAGKEVVIELDPAKDITTQAYLKKFYNQYATDTLAVTYDIADYPLDLPEEKPADGEDTKKATSDASTTTEDTSKTSAADKAPKAEAGIDVLSKAKAPVKKTK